MAFSKESLTYVKTSSLPYFLLWRLNVSVEVITRSSISLSSILTCEFAVSFKTWGCVFGDKFIFCNVSINCAVFNQKVYIINHLISTT